MSVMFNQFDYWHWLIFAALLLILEVTVPGAFFLWMSISAGIVGILALAFPALGWQIELLIFAVLAVVSAVTWRLYLKRHPVTSDQPKLNRRGEQYVGRILTLKEGIVNGQGKIKVDDSTWKIEGEDCPPGTRVKVVGVDNVILQVQRLDLA
jgi:membrane protein implicated in regulation of membrane protease activity